MQPDISPLAKRLAEENNVEWQGLYGSGSDGRIVERDVLEYLARVMAGEENLNPTPEPLPAGMEAWPEETSAQATALKSSGPPVQVADDEPAYDEYAADEYAADEMLLTDESFGTPAAATPRVEISRAASAGEPEDAINDDIFLFDDSEDELRSESAVQDGRAPDLAAPDTLFAEDDAFGEGVTFDTDETSTDLGLSFDLGVTTGVTAAKNVEADPTLQNQAASDFSFDSDFGDTLDTAPAARPAEFGVLSGLDTQDDFADTDEDEMLAATSAKGLNPDTPDVALFGGATTDEAEDKASLFLDNADNTRNETHYGTTETKLEDAAPMPDESNLATTGAESKAAQSQAAPSLVSYGLLLRRHVDLTEFRQAQAALGQEVAGPVSPSSLLLRAAAKALGAAPLNGRGTVGLAVFGDRAVQVAAVPDILKRPFRELVSEVARPDAETAQGSSFAVIVADMSELDIDEAVLNAGAPVLTLGRVLLDGDAGRYTGTLSLSGDLTAEEGARFLAAVADLLATPIRLVV